MTLDKEVRSGSSKIKQSQAKRRHQTYCDPAGELRSINPAQVAPVDTKGAEFHTPRWHQESTNSSVLPFICVMWLQQSQDSLAEKSHSCQLLKVPQSREIENKSERQSKGSPGEQ